ncbi:MAG: WG repeat-containing protein [Candidatus Scatosoma sp.]
MKKILKKAMCFGAAALTAITAFAGCASKENKLFNAEMFEEDLVPVQSESGKYGFINEKGNEAIACTYDAAKMFFNGLAPVQTDGKWGYVNEKGEMQIAAKYDKAGCFYTDDCAVVGVLKGTDVKYGLIDKKGNTLAEANFDRIEGFYDHAEFYEGEFVKKDLSVAKKGDKYGLIDMKGNYAVNPDYVKIEQTYFGGYELTRVKEGLLAGTEKNVADKSGKLISSVWYDDIGDTDSSDFIPVKSDDKWGAINAKGQTVAAPSYKAISAFYNDCAVFKNDDGKYGVLDEKGQIKAQPTYDGIDNFGGFGYEFDASAAKKGDAYALLSDDGKELTGFIYKYVERVSEDRFVCKDTSDKVGLISDDGKTLVEFGKYEKISAGAEGALFDNFIVKNADGKYGVIDEDGKEIVAPQYEKIESCLNGMFIAERGEGNNEECAVFTLKNKEVIPFGAYDEIDGIYADGYIVVEKDGKKGIVKKDGSALIEPKYKEIRGYNALYVVLSDLDMTIGL